MTRRLGEAVLAALLMVVLLPLLLGIGLALLLAQGRPVFYLQERMRAPDRAFRLVKFRTMRPVQPGEAEAVATGGHSLARVTPMGRILRETRLDELPQLFNILKGEMGFVGPRPPLRRHVEACPELYARVLRLRPGVTGLASILFHRHEAWLLSAARTPEETEAIYIRRCIPRKARLDLIHQRNRSLALDLYILYLTAATLLPLPGRRARRLRRPPPSVSPPPPPP